MQTALRSVFICGVHVSLIFLCVIVREQATRSILNFENSILPVTFSELLVQQSWARRFASTRVCSMSI